jgi:hypothetical protein
MRASRNQRAFWPSRWSFPESIIKDLHVPKKLTDLPALNREAWLPVALDAVHPGVEQRLADRGQGRTPLVDQGPVRLGRRLAAAEDLLAGSVRHRLDSPGTGRGS